VVSEHPVHMLSACLSLVNPTPSYFYTNDIHVSIITPTTTTTI